MAVLESGLGTLGAGRGMSASHIGRFARWYGGQARGLLPERVARWLLEPSEPGLIIEIGPVGDRDGPAPVWVTPVRGERRFETQVVAGDAPRVTGTMVAKVRARGGEVFLKIPAQICLTRTFDIPREAVERLSGLLDAEVVRRTPFALADVVHGARVKANAGESFAGEALRLTVRQAIVRRDLAEEEALRGGMRLADFDGLRVDEPDGGGAVTMRMRAARVRPQWPGRMAGLLTGACVVIAGAGIVATLRGLEAGQARVTIELTQATAKAQAVRSLVDGASGESRLLSSLRAAKSERPQLSDIIEELSRLLPEGTWVSELRLFEDKPGEPLLSITGYSDRATGLVALLERSQMFAGTALAAAITPDPVEGRDRFQLQTRLAVTAGAARGKS